MDMAIDPAIINPDDVVWLGTKLHQRQHTLKGCGFVR